MDITNTLSCTVYKTKLHKTKTLQTCGPVQSLVRNDLPCQLVADMENMQKSYKE